MKSFLETAKDFFDILFLKSFLAFVFVLFVLLVISYFLLGWDAFLTMDRSIQDSVFSLRSDTMTKFMVFATNFGDKIIIFPLTLLIFLYLFFRKKYYFIMALFSSSFVSALVVYLVKLLFARERPLNFLIEADGFSFPSGHAMVAVAFYGVLSYFAYVFAKNRWERWISVFLGAFLVFLVSFSRVYLGVHFPSDVFFGIVFAGIWLGFVVYLTEIKRTKKQLPK